jgi:RNA polymerase sigma-70 factor (ECF subfamily)
MTAPAADAGTAFDEHRRVLFAVAYQLLGSVADAEDTVQDTWLRWSSADRDDVVDVRAYLVRIASRLALNRLRAAQVRREVYVGPWLPEPMLTGPDDGPATIGHDPAVTAEIGVDVSLALLVVLETLSPAERAVFVLREVFGMSHAEVAAALDRSESAVRQLAHRAREHVQARRPRFSTDRRTTREVTEQFLTACGTGDVAALMAALSPDVVLISDAGGKARAARRPITGAAKVARFLAAVGPEGTADPSARWELVELNGLPGVVGWSGSQPMLAASLVVVDGRVEQVLIMMNPDKLRGITTPAPSPRPPAGARREPASDGGAGGPSTLGS